MDVLSRLRSWRKPLYQQNTEPGGIELGRHVNISQQPSSAPDHRHQEAYDSARAQHSVEVESNTAVSATVPTQVESTSRLEDAAIDKEPQDCVFLCLNDSSGGQHAIKVPCRRTPGPVDQDARSEHSDSQTVDHDVDTFERLTAAYFTSKGMWRRWLPFYDVLEVREVEVRWVSVSPSLIPALLM